MVSFTVNLVVPALPAHHREAVQELNTSVPVAASSADLADDFLAQFQVCFCLTNLCACGCEGCAWWSSMARSGRWWWQRNAAYMPRVPLLARYCRCCSMLAATPYRTFWQVVVATDTTLAESIRIDEFCHANGIAFIKVRCRSAAALAQQRAAACSRCLALSLEWRLQAVPHSPAQSGHSFLPSCTGRHPRRVRPGVLRLWPLL